LDTDQIQERIASAVAGVFDWLVTDGSSLLGKSGYVVTITDGFGAGVMSKLQACLMREDLVATIRLSPELTDSLKMAALMGGAMQTVLVDKAAMIASQELIFVLSGDREDGRADLGLHEVQAAIDQLMDDWDNDIFTGVLGEFLIERDKLVELRGVLKAIAENERRNPSARKVSDQPASPR